MKPDPRAVLEAYKRSGFNHVEAQPRKTEEEQLLQLA